MLCHIQEQWSPQQQHHENYKDSRLWDWLCIVAWTWNSFSVKPRTRQLVTLGYMYCLTFYYIAAVLLSVGDTVSGTTGVLSRSNCFLNGQYITHNYKFQIYYVHRVCRWPHKIVCFHAFENPHQTPIQISFQYQPDYFLPSELFYLIFCVGFSPSILVESWTLGSGSSECKEKYVSRGCPFSFHSYSDLMTKTCPPKLRQWS